MRHFHPFLSDQFAALTHRLFDQLSALLSEQEPRGLLARQPLSMAHGWPGLLYALMRTGAVLDVPTPDELRPRVEQVMNLIRATFSGAAASMDVPGWCNGAAGHVAMFIATHQMLGEPSFLAAAHAAASRTAMHPDRHGHLCCGRSGRTFALLALHRHTGERRWLEEARRLARTLIDAPMPAEATNPSRSLWWGRAGSMLALEETRMPQWAAMPIFGPWGWPVVPPVKRRIARPETRGAIPDGLE